MAPLQSVGAHIELKCDADKFFDVWVHKPYLVTKMCPNKITKVELREGMNWHAIGALLTWNYAFTEIGESAFVNARIEELNEENNSVRYNVEDGFVMNNYYKTMYTNIQATPKGNSQGCIVNWCFEYEELNSDAPDPNMYLNFMLSVVNDVDAFLCKKNP